jgi:hypothetical protein
LVRIDLTVKANLLLCPIFILITSIISILMTQEAFCQQVIKLKNGKEYKAVINSQLGDTLKYQLLAKPNKKSWVLMSEVDTILEMKTPKGIRFPGQVTALQKALDTMPEERKKELYLHYREKRNLGFGFLIGGAVVTGIGLGIFIPAATEIQLFGSTPEWAEKQIIPGAILTGIGGVGLLTGIILTIKGSVRMKRYAPKLEKISLDLRFELEQKGFSLIYRF